MQKNKYWMGINSSHNSSVAIMDESGKIIFALQEERLSRNKNHWSLPVKSIKKAIEIVHGWENIEKIIFAGIVHPATDRNISRDDIKSGILSAIGQKKSLKSFISKKKHIFEINLNQKKYLQNNIKKFKKNHINIFRKNFPEVKDNPIEFVEHHDTHFATASFGGSEAFKKDLLIFTYDGQGDGLCGTVSILRSNGVVENLHKIQDQNSLSTLYGFTTFYLGLTIFEHEYKLMGMAPYANYSRSLLIKNKLKELYECKDKGWVLKNKLRYVDIDESKFYKEIENIYKLERFDEICLGVQLLVEEFLTQWVSFWINKTGVNDIALSGGMFLNVKANLKLMELNSVNSIYIFPSCGDETNCIGALYYKYFINKNKPPKPITSMGLGQAIESENIEKEIYNYISENKLNYKVDIKENIEDEVAELLSIGEIVGRVEGKEEFGARALGNRSILANPSNWEAISKINDMIKKRDFWMPFAASILDKCYEKYVQDPKKINAEYMIMSFKCTDHIKDIIAGTHPKDKTVRPQIVRKKTNPSYYKIIDSFYKKTGIGAVLNTSLNLHGYPLASSVNNAMEVLQFSELKYLAISKYLIKKV